MHRAGNTGERNVVVSYGSLSLVVGCRAIDVYVTVSESWNVSMELIFRAITMDAYGGKVRVSSY